MHKNSIMQGVQKRLPFQIQMRALIQKIVVVHWKVLSRLHSIKFQTERLTSGSAHEKFDF